MPPDLPPSLAQAKIIAETAKAKAVQIKLDARADAFDLLKTELGYSNDVLLKWMLTDQIRELSTDSKLAVNVNKALLNLN